MKVYKNIIAGGCSFTADGIGGSPPTDASEGNCSFLSYPGIDTATPFGWASHVAAALQPKSFVNLAGHGHGNIMTAQVIPEMFRRYRYHKDDTLVIFNLTEPERMDVACDWASPDRSGLVGWSPEILPYTFVGPAKPVMTSLKKTMGLEQIAQTSAVAVDLLFTWLEHHNVDFLFAMMNDYTQYPVMQKTLKIPEHAVGRSNRMNHCVTFDGLYGMREYVAVKKINTGDGEHPDADGHRAIAQKFLALV